MKPLFRIDGVDSLSAKAYLASVIGPRRVALGVRHKVTLRDFNPVKIAENTGAAGVDRACYVSVSLAGGQGLTTPPVLFGSDNSPSDDNGILQLIGPQIGSPIYSFSAVLYPSEQLYAALPTDVLALGITLPIALVVSQEWF